MKIVMAEVAGVRRTGSAALDMAWTAAGRFDAYWERNIKPWDIAAGLCIMREAGGTAVDLKGGADMLETGDILVGNASMVKGLLPLITGT